jgi:hypothetical protein
MKICVVLPGKDQLATAGVRIRYQRIGARLAEQGHELTLAEIDAVQPKQKSKTDIYIISKCYDARSLLLAAALHANGLRVGIDVFDDYFSQTDDSRFVHLRRWLAEIAKSLSFVLCSTPLLRATLSNLLPDIACHMMNDPCDALDLEGLGSRLETKLERARSTGIIDISWFGIGENAYFPVGLSDLHAFGHCLASLAGGGVKPRLSILTNRRALSAEKLQALGRLPVAWRIEEWSEEAEAHLVAESYACFLPVNAQRFSMVKSLNRAVTAFSGGCQVLSTGYPLYEGFAKLVYRDGAALRAGVTKGEPKLRPATTGTLSRMLENMASPEREARALAKFLAGTSAPRQAEAERRFAVVHGRLSTAAVHKYAQRQGHLSVAGPRSVDLNYDLTQAIHPETGAPVILLSAQAMKRLKPGLRPLAQTIIDIGGRKAHVLPLDALEADQNLKRTSPLMDFEPVFLANYRDELGKLRALAAALFVNTPVVVSESASPFWEGPAEAGRGSA